MRYSYRFPRTAGEAFKDAEYASPVTRYSPRMHRNDRIVVAGCLVAALALFAILAVAP